MLVKDLTQSQFDSIDVIERVCSTLSLFGCFFVIVSYTVSSAFKKPINKLVFLASLGNIISNVATIISRNALLNLNGFLCQFQGFLIQM